MSATTSSYMRSGSATVQRNADVLPFPFPARPQAMTIYVRFEEIGSILTNDARILQIGLNTNPRLFFFMGGAVYRFTHRTANGSVNAILAVAPSIGDGVELVGQINADGSIKLIQSIGGAAETETSQTSALVLQPAWSDTLLWLNNVAGLSDGFTAYRNVVVERGVQPLATMRRLAGVI